MTYWEFHLVFTLPVVALLGLLTLRDLRRGENLCGSLGHGSSGRGTRFAAWAVLAHIVIALVYTTPWDNYLIHSGVWGYPPGRVLFTIGYVPFEEYLFFVIQTVIAGLFFYLLARRLDAPPTTFGPTQRSRIRFVGSLLVLGLAALGVVALASDRGTYLGLILVWGTPVLALQWGYGGDFISERWRLLLPAVFIPTLYLWVADRVAIGLDIWWISPELSTGLKILGLPVEEALFFLMTNLFVLFGLSLALHPESVTRYRRLRGLVRLEPWQVLLGLWALSMVPTPLVPGAFPVFAYLSTSLLALGLLGYALGRYGVKAWLLFGLAFGFGLAVEYLGETTGLPFGVYRYTAPGPSLFGVPLLVPLGWWAFTLIALSITPPGRKLFLAPLAMVAWDLGLDPLMVSKGFWSFEGGGFYYGVPLMNFVGWYLAGFVLVWLMLRLEPRLQRADSFELRFVFTAQAFLISVGLVFFGLPVAGLVTFVAMGAFALPPLLRARAEGRLLPTK